MTVYETSQVFLSPGLAESETSSQLSQFTVYFFFNQVFKNLFIYLLAALGLCCCARAFSSCGERGILFVAVRRLLIKVASLVAEHGL